MRRPVVERPSPNHEPRLGDGIDILLLHYTGMGTAASACAWLCDPVSKVSSHYLVDEAGVVFRLVDEEARAWHAGVSYWAGETDINSRSIGIEIHNLGHESGCPPFPDVQIDAVIELAQGILKRHPIPPYRILAHSDVAPGRKRDPGEAFPWERLAEAGIGLLPLAVDSGLAALEPGSQGAAVESLQRDLYRFGYRIDMSACYDIQTQTVVTEFQRHFRRLRVDGVADGETRALARAVADHVLVQSEM